MKSVPPRESSEFSPKKRFYENLNNSKNFGPAESQSSGHKNQKPNSDEKKMSILRTALGKEISRIVNQSLKRQENIEREAEQVSEKVYTMRSNGRKISKKLVFLIVLPITLVTVSLIGFGIYVKQDWVAKFSFVDKNINKLARISNNLNLVFNMMYQSLSEDNLLHNVKGKKN